MNSHERFTQLWSEYLEGELDEAGMHELQQILAAEPECRALAIQQYEIHRALGVLSQKDQDLFVRETLKQVPISTDEFVAKVIARVDATVHASSKTVEPGRQISTPWIAVALLALVASLVLILFRQTERDVPKPPNAVVADAKVKFIHTAQTKFLGAFAPEIGSEAIVDHEYILTSGSVQLQFPAGAEVIVQGPAVFQVAGIDRLNVTIGRCSVYCPKGAEGFVVDTPNARVVDRGTRFFVNAVESAATEVHVVDGIADVFQNAKSHTSQSEQAEAPKADANQAAMVRLTKNEARMVESDIKPDPRPSGFRSNLYQYRLPDRVISYQATHENGGVKYLTSVDVQRDGTVQRYPIAELIASRLTWFKIEEKIVDMRHLAGEPDLPNSRMELMLDTALNTGVINPGGSVEPFAGDPVFPGSKSEGDTTTSGFAIEFDSPVVNRPGPDVLFFELQSVTGAPDGDPFHVLPLKLAGKRHAITIRSYDLTLTSPESQRPANFYLHEFDRSVDSIEVLTSASCRVLARPQGSAGYRVLAVAIDLSAMGFQDGEAVEGLFFQDSLDDHNHIDPVAILGLPATH